MQVFLHAPNLGADAGPEFELFCEEGNVAPNLINRLQLISGVNISVPDSAKIIKITSTGIVKNSVFVSIDNNCSNGSSPTPTATPTPTPTFSATPVATATPTLTPTITATPTSTEPYNPWPAISTIDFPRQSAENIFNLNVGDAFTINLINKQINFVVSLKKIYEEDSSIFISAKEVTTSKPELAYVGSFSSVPANKNLIKFFIRNEVSDEAFSYKSFNDSNSSKISEYKKAQFFIQCPSKTQ